MRSALIQVAQPPKMPLMRKNDSSSLHHALVKTRRIVQTHSVLFWVTQLACIMALGQIAFAATSASIHIDKVSKYGSKNGYVSGHVSGVTPADYGIATYILVDGGWWTKPTSQYPLATMKKRGTFKVDITTSGQDERATQIVVFLMPNGTAPIPRLGESDLPDQGIAKAEITRNQTKTPSIQLSDVPPYGQSGQLKGKVTGMKPKGYELEIYIQVEDVYWTKPTYDSPFTSIKPNGTFSCNITTGEYDQFGTTVKAFLVPKGTPATICDPCCELTIPQALVTATYYRGPNARTLEFMGETFEVKKRDFPAGPGGNYFSDAVEDVYIDNDGLNLHTGNRDGKWYGSEVIMKNSYGYGTYVIVTKGWLDSIDPNIVIGLFTWDKLSCLNSFNEMDIEFAKWGQPDNLNNAQYVVQPCNMCPGCGNSCNRFRLDQPGNDDFLTHYLVWSQDQVEFRTYYGRYVEETPPASALAAKWIFSGTNIPQPAHETIRFNTWLINGQPPYFGQGQQVTVNHFNYQQAPPIWNDEPPVTPGPPVISIDSISTIGETNGNVWGHVTGVIPSSYSIAVYIKVGNYWWTKPYDYAPNTAIQSDMSWMCDITTGGLDTQATEIVAYLIPISYDPPIVLGAPELPLELAINAVGVATGQR